MVYDRNAELIHGPIERLRIAALAGKEYRFEPAQICLLDEAAIGILAPDGTQCSWGGEHDLDPMLVDDAPKCTGIRSADWLTLEQHRGAAVEQRRIDDVRMPDDPADVGCRPETRRRHRRHRCSSSSN